MVEITPRLIAKPHRPGKLKSVTREPEELPKFGNFLRGQQTYLSSKSPLRCYYYNKQARGRWSSAERSITGMRWNAYLVSGKTLPKLEPLAPQKMQVVKGLMREIEVRKEKGIQRDAGRMGGGAAEIISGPRKPGDKQHSRIRQEEPARPQIISDAGQGLPQAGQKMRAGRGKTKSHPQTGSAGSAQNEKGGRGANGNAEGPRKLSSHPGFRHLRIVREPSESIASVLEIRPGARESGKARAEFPAASAPHITIQELHEPLASPPAQMASGAAGFMKVTLVHGDADEPAPAHSATPTALLAHMMAPFRPGAFPPANDTFIPHEPWPPCAVSARACEAQEIGYISSGRRRAFQLKCAQGAAALPQ